MRHGPRQAFVDYEPWTRKLEHALEPGMVVRPRDPQGRKIDQKRWVVERVSGAMTRARTGGPRHFTSQYWATDTLIPVKFKRTAGTTAAERSAKSAESRARVPREGDDISERLKAAQGLGALIAVARDMGYPDCDTLAGKIGHLNPGLQRMNVGNRLRSWLSRKEGGG